MNRDDDLFLIAAAAAAADVGAAYLDKKQFLGEHPQQPIVGGE